MNPLQSLHDYEEFVYTLKQRFPSINSSTLVLVRRGKCVATLQGEIMFSPGFRIAVKERLSFDEGSVVIEDYAYELWDRGDKLAWYDAQPHPDDPNLASTHPHHKHIPPDIKHNRIPAPNMRFNQSNLSALIQEIEELLKSKE